jgi:hypothetical protein
MTPPRSYRGLLLIVFMWALAAAIAALSATNLFGLARLIGYTTAMGVGMFANDAINLDAMFPRMRRAWIATGAIRAATAAWGAITVMYIAVVQSNNWRSSLLTAMIAGFIAGGLAGTVMRTFREVRPGEEHNTR